MDLRAVAIVGLVVFYSVLIVTDVYLMSKYARKGPEGDTDVESSDVEKGVLPNVS